MHADYKQWRQPDQPGMSCCNDADCRPTRAFKDDFGHWRAWDGRRWLFVPPAKVLAPDLLRDGRSHLCASPEGNVYCLSPAEPKI
ncbi:hypothetical protein [Reyranella sp.]|uniref:hypothetical protein n=1 Tax=Reyranella sp. TaxID=1929291 RepID=UPI003D0CC03D